MNNWIFFRISGSNPNPRCMFLRNPNPNPNLNLKDRIRFHPKIQILFISRVFRVGLVRVGRVERVFGFSCSPLVRDTKKGRDMRIVAARIQASQFSSSFTFLLCNLITWWLLLLVLIWWTWTKFLLGFQWMFSKAVLWSDFYLFFFLYVWSNVMYA